MTSEIKEKKDKFSNEYENILKCRNKVLNVLNIKCISDKARSLIEAELALIHSVFYKDDRTMIDWVLIQKYWIFNASGLPMITDKQFSKIQCWFSVMRTLGERYILKSSGRYTTVIYESLGQSNVNLMELFNVVIYTHPLYVIAIYPRLVDLPFSDADKAFNFRTIIDYELLPKESMFLRKMEIVSELDELISTKDHDYIRLICQ